MTNLLDEFAKSVASGLSRRQALWRMCGLFTGSMLAVLGWERTARAASLGAAACTALCEQLYPNCVKECVRICVNCPVPSTTAAAAPPLCGTCRDLVCCQGTCCPGTSTSPPICTNVERDPRNCGKCGTACPRGQRCCGGVCCPLGDHCCDDVCVDLLGDSANCGRCGRVCPVTATGAPTVCCNGVCCPPGTACVNGVCTATCTPNTPCVTAAGVTGVCCNGVCVNPGRFSSDPNNCGSCGLVCPATSPVCCGGVCVQPSTDSANCGGCGNVCPTITIVGTTAGSTTTIAEVCCHGRCVNPGRFSSDPNNCGACGNVCPAGSACVNGVCTGINCPPGYTLCGTVCVNLNNDNVNCGACGNICPLGTSAAGATVCCGGKCVPVSSFASDPNNCGRCGISCANSPAGPVCVAGVCGPGPTTGAPA